MQPIQIKGPRARAIAALVVCLSAGLSGVTAVVAADDVVPPATILRDVQAHGGLIVHVGCGDGKLTTALFRTDTPAQTAPSHHREFRVQGLDRDKENIEKARRNILSQGLWPKVSVKYWDQHWLPYVDNLVDVIVVEDTRGLPDRELMRVLSPGGTIFTKEKGRWTKRKKPWPQDIDEWTHFLHGPDNNAVSDDWRAGPPRHLQWRSEPLWSRYHHTLSSISAAVSAAGRIFYIADRAPAASIQIDADWHLVARGAFNGLLLWRKKLPSWASHRRGFRSGPVQLPRTLVATDDRVYVPLGVDAAVAAIDAQTGDVIRTYEGTDGAEELIVDNGTLFAVAGEPAAEQSLPKVNPEKAQKQHIAFPNQKTLAAIRAETGDLLWEWSDSEAAPLMPLTLTVDEQRVFLQTGGGIACLDRDTGQLLWKTEQIVAPPSRLAGWCTATLVFSDGVVLWADGKGSGSIGGPLEKTDMGRIRSVKQKVRALSAEDGSLLWSCEAGTTFFSPTDLLVVDGLVWLGWDFTEARDLHTGQIKRSNRTIHDLWTVGHHHRCYRNKATRRFILTGKRGIEFVALDSPEHSRNNWIRGACQYGVMPCNGLIYAPPHCCGCYMEAKLYGFFALASSRKIGTQPEDDRAARLVRGPAYGEANARRARAPEQSANAWPTFRHDALRSASTDTKLPEDLAQAWETEIGPGLTSPVIADGLLIACCADTNTVIALDSEDGAPRWQFAAGGPVDSPPTIYDGLVLFGCGDGYVYCLRASDGEPVWRFRAAPRDLYTVDCGQLESVWPVHGSVLVLDGVAYAAAGRSTYLDDGAWLYALDPRSGQVLHEKHVRSDHAGVQEPPSEQAAEEEVEWIAQNRLDWKTFNAPDRSDAWTIRGALNDVLVSDGYSIYMKNMRFDRALQRAPTKGRHLFSTSRLVNPIEVHRSHWVLGTGDFSRMPVAYPWIVNNRKGWGKLRLGRPYGVMLAFDEQTAWGVWRRYNRPGYLLFAQDNAPFSESPEGRPDFRTFEQRKSPDMIWSTEMSMRPRAMLRAGPDLILGGNQDWSEAQDPIAAYRGEEGGLLWVFSASDGTKKAEYELAAPPVWNGIAAADDSLFLTTTDGKVVCYRSESSP